MIRVIIALIVFTFIGLNAKSDQDISKEWTFLVFMNGNNSLDPQTLPNIKLMEKIGSTEQVNIIVQYASYKSKNVQRLYIKKGSSEVVEDLGSRDMGDYLELMEFIEWSVKNYPAKKYFIDIWNHGTGWHDGGIGGTPYLNKNSTYETADISFDDITGHFITTEQMGLVMERFASLIGHKVNIYGNDACLMSMIEILTEVKDSVSYFIGSQELEPEQGWPYDKFLNLIRKNPYLSELELGRGLTSQYKEYYHGASDITLSMMDLSRLDDLLLNLSDLREALVESPYRASMIRIANSAQSYVLNYDYKDLYGFIKGIYEDPEFVFQSHIALKILSLLKEIIVSNEVSKDEIGSHGISIWMPTDIDVYDYFSKRYKSSLRFEKETRWSELLETLARPEGSPDYKW